MMKIPFLRTSPVEEVLAVKKRKMIINGTEHRVIKSGKPTMKKEGSIELFIKYPGEKKPAKKGETKQTTIRVTRAIF